MTQEKYQPKNPKNILVFTIGLLSYFSLVPSAFAQIVTCPDPPFELLCFQKESIGGILGALISLIFIAAVVATLLYLLWGAVKWIFSGGDKTAVETARGTIAAAIIGLIILFLSFLVINILLGFFNVNIGEITVPSIPSS
jgi:hypothetical protein